MKTIPACILFVALTILSARAFPPAPYYTLYGIVRDQVGQTITAEGAVIILLKGGIEIGRTPIASNIQIDQNYELKIRIDANRPSTRTYHESAIAASGLFSLVVEMNGSLFYPIEVSGNLTAGKGGERVRLDLNLGEDSDGDGLPDAWEQWQLYQAGHYPDENGNWDLSLIDKNGDFDGDGQSNWFEYVAGTFAGDRTDRFDMSIKEKADTFVRFEFYAITGKTYTMERSTDGKTWTSAPIAITPAGQRFAAHLAPAVAIVPLYCDPMPGAGTELYRLKVR